MNDGVGAPSVMPGWQEARDLVDFNRLQAARRRHFALMDVYAALLVGGVPPDVATLVMSLVSAGALPYLELKIP